MKYASTPTLSIGFEHGSGLARSGQGVIRSAFLAAVVVALLTSTATSEQNLLWNPSFADSRAADPDHPFRRWYSEAGEPYTLTRRGDWFPYYAVDGDGWHYATDNGDYYSELHQDIDLENPFYGLDQQRLAKGGYFVEFGGWQRSYPDLPADAGTISLEQYWLAPSPPQTVLPSVTWSLSWVHSAGSAGIHPGASMLTYSFLAVRNDQVGHGGYNDAWLDGAHLYIKPSSIWSLNGDDKHSLYGQGDRTITGNHWLNLHTYITREATLHTTAAVSGDQRDGQRSEVHIHGGQWLASGEVSLLFSRININDGLWTSQGPRTAVGVLRSAEVNIAPGGSWNSLTGVIIGDSGNGTVNINGGLWTAEANSSVLLGSDGYGKVNISGGGRWLSRAAVTVGDLQFGSGAIVVGDGNDANTAQWTSDAAVEILSGSVELRSGGCWLSSGGVTVGADDGSGSILISGGTWKIPYAAWLHGGTSLTMTGGKIQAATLRIDGTASISGGSIELPNAGSLLLVTGQMLRLNGAEICGDGTILTEYGVGLGNGRLAGSDSSHRLTVNADLFGPGLAEHVDLLGQIHLGPAAGQLTLRDVNFGIDAALVLEIDASVADDNGRLVLGPFTELDGVGLQIVFADGFVPAGGSEIELVCAGDGTSLAAALSGAAVQVPEGCSFDSTTGVLTVIPEPTTIALLAAGAVGLIRRRGRSARRQRRA